MIKNLFSWILKKLNLVSVSPAASSPVLPYPSYGTMDAILEIDALDGGPVFKHYLTTKSVLLENDPTGKGYLTVRNASVSDVVPVTDLEVPQVPEVVWQTEATAIVELDVFAPWMRSIQEYLKKSGAVNGVDFSSSVSSHRTVNGKPGYKVHWKAKSEAGVQYIQLMSRTFRTLEHEKRPNEAETRNQLG